MARTASNAADFVLAKNKSGGASPSPRLRGEGRGEGYKDIPGFCKSATTADIAGHGHALTPGRCVGAEEVEDDGDPFEERMPRLIAELHAQFAEWLNLATIRALPILIPPRPRPSHRRALPRAGGREIGGQTAGSTIG